MGDTRATPEKQAAPGAAQETHSTQQQPMAMAIDTKPTAAVMGMAAMIRDTVKDAVSPLTSFICNLDMRLASLSAEVAE